MQGRHDPSSQPNAESTGQPAVSAEWANASQPAPRQPELRPGQTTLLEEIVSVAPAESDHWLDSEQTSRYNNVSNLTGESPVFCFAKRAREIGAGRAPLWSTRPIAVPAQVEPPAPVAVNAPVPAPLQPRVAQPPALPVPAQPSAARPGLTPPAGFLGESVSVRHGHAHGHAPAAVAARTSAPPPPPLPRSTPMPAPALQSRATGSFSPAAAVTAPQFVPPPAHMPHMPGMNAMLQAGAMAGQAAAYGVDPGVLHQLQRQLILALERVRASEARSAEAERRAQWAEQIASEAKRQSGMITPVRPPGVVGHMARGVVSAAALSLVCFSIGGYLSLLIPVRQRVLTQEAALRGLTEVRAQLERQNQGLAEKLHQLDPQRFEAPHESSAEAHPQTDTTVLAERSAKR